MIAMIFDSNCEAPRFFVFEDDEAKSFDGCYINCDGGELFTEFMYDEEGERQYEPVSREEFRQAIINGAELIVAGEIM